MSGFPRRYDGPFQKVKAHTVRRKGKGVTAKLRAARKTQQRTKDKRVYELVDLRDGLRSRLSGTAGRIERHHIRYRSRGGRTTLDNVISLTQEEHAAIHAGKLKLEGNAEEMGGVRVWWLLDLTGEWVERASI